MRRLVARVTIAASVATAVPLAVGHASPATAVVPPEHKVYFVTESVGLGARNALYAAFPPDWQVTVDGTPALFVEQLESKHVRARMAIDPGRVR